jgi:hypothetical protein
MGSYVSAEIEGQKLDSAFEIDRSHLRENQTVWIMNEVGQLEIRSVQIGFSGSQKVYVTTGLAENELLVTTDIAAPVQGMPLRVAGAGRQARPSGRPPAGKKGKP